MTSGAVIALDVGATTTRLCVSKAGKLVILPKAERIVPTPDRWEACTVSPTIYKWRTPSQFWFTQKNQLYPSAKYVQEVLIDLLAKVATSLLRWLPELNITTITIAFAGTIKADSNHSVIVTSSPNIWGAESCSLTKELRLKIPAPINIFVISDDVAGANRYVRIPTYTNFANELHYVNVGSGLSGLRVNLPSRQFYPYECGHMQVIHDSTDPLFMRCACGGIGHLETIVAGRGCEKIASILVNTPKWSSQSLALAPTPISKPTQVDTYTIVRGLHANNPLASFIVEQSAQFLTDHVVAPILIKNPDWSRLRIVINGGFIRGVGPSRYIGTIKSRLLHQFSCNLSGRETLLPGLADGFDPLFGAADYTEIECRSYFIHEAIIGVQTSDKKYFTS